MTVGGWDEDAAEHVAYHAATHQAFVASAEASVVTVLSVADPTNINVVGTLDIATSLYSAACGDFAAESVQSVAIVTSADYANGMVAAAAPASDSTQNGYLAFYDASTLAFLGCAEAGNKPEGIASQGNKVACINEGSAPDDGSADNEGSMTMCDVTVPSGAPLFSCSTYTLSEANFVDNDWTGMLDCIYYYGVDYGGNTNPCGYAPMVAIAVNDDTFSFPGWFSGPQIIDTTMTSAGGVPGAVCGATRGVTSSRTRRRSRRGTEYRECYMKEAHDYSAVHCHAYDSWEFDDLFWEGHSGPATCGQWKAADAFRGTDVRLYGPEDTTPPRRGARRGARSRTTGCTSSWACRTTTRTPCSMSSRRSTSSCRASGTSRW